MDDIISVGSSPPPSIPLKRAAPDDESTECRPINLKGTQFLIPTPPSATDTGDQAAHSMAAFARELSPAASISTLSSIQDVSSVGNADAVGSSATSKSTDGAPPTKKRKLTPAEKVEQQRLKDIKAQEKAEKKLAKDEEKRVNDEKKRLKAEEREDKKREKALEEERKNQEKLKKERSQMRLGAFFGRPAATTQDDPYSTEPSPEKVPFRRRSMSLETFEAVQDQIMKDSPDKPANTVIELPKAAKALVSDYQRFFLPYQPKSHTSLTDHALLAGPEAEELQARFDAEVHATQEHYDLGLYPVPKALNEYFDTLVDRHRGTIPVPTRKLWAQTLSSSERPIDLTSDSAHMNLQQELAKISMRHLHFQEDVRPAYFGTYTQINAQSAIAKLRRNPFAKKRTDTDYDYDSETEWEEPDPDGEDIDNEDEDDESIGDEEEMEGFLDDENDELKARRKLVVSDLEAHSSGLCWENEVGKLRERADSSPSRALKGLRIQFLIPGFQDRSIDPFSSSYWQPEKPPEDNLLRPPLKERSSNTANVKSDEGWPTVVLPKPQSSAKKGVKPGTQKTMSAEELCSFKTQVVGSVLGKQELTTKLKNVFPNLTVLLIKDTLGEKFAQVGKTKAFKKWVFVGSA